MVSAYETTTYQKAVIACLFITFPGDHVVFLTGDNHHGHDAACPERQLFCVFIDVDPGDVPGEKFLRLPLSCGRAAGMLGEHQWKTGRARQKEINKIRDLDCLDSRSSYLVHFGQGNCKR